MDNVRKKLLVDDRVQGALALRIAIHWVAFFLVSLICLFSLEYFMGDPQLTLQGHLAVLWQKYAFFVLLMLCIVPSFVYDSMKLSNKFAGPMVRLRESIRRIADGEEVKQIRFREGDFWQDVSTEFNRMTKTIGRQIESPSES